MTWREKQIREIARGILAEEANRGFTLKQKQIIQSWIEKYEHAKPISAEPVKLRTTVLTFDKSGKQSSYSFTGKPNIPRIECETIREGMLAVIVNPCEGHTNALLIHSDKIFPIPEGKRGWFDASMFSPSSRGWNIKQKELGVWIDRIQKAIVEWRETQPNQEHYDGELFVGGIHEVSKRNLSINYCLVYHEYRFPSRLEWFVNKAGNAIYRDFKAPAAYPCWVLRTVLKQEPTDEDWVGEIGGVKVRATETEKGYICMDYIKSRACNQFINDDQIRVAREICQQNHIPIKPFNYKK